MGGGVRRLGSEGLWSREVEVGVRRVQFREIGGVG